MNFFVCQSGASHLHLTHFQRHLHLVHHLLEQNLETNHPLSMAKHLSEVLAPLHIVLALYVNSLSQFTSFTDFIMSSSIEITSHDDTIDLFEGKHIIDL